LITLDIAPNFLNIYEWDDIIILTSMTLPYYFVIAVIIYLSQLLSILKGAAVISVRVTNMYSILRRNLGKLIISRSESHDII
jgi:hypothetical protein